jgi:hypothetical protein
MSLILDALKKLDRENAARSGGTVNITAEILKGDPAPRKKGISALLIIMGITACVAGVITFLVVAGSGTRTGDSRPQIPIAVVQPPTTPAAVAVPPPASRDAVSGHSNTAFPPAVGTGTAKGSANIAERRRASDDADPPGKALPQPEDKTAARPVLKVSGIVWQEEPSERKAMINGTVVREGDTVEGAKILEIYPSHVFVSFKGKSFKVTMFE